MDSTRVKSPSLLLLLIFVNAPNHRFTVPIELVADPVSSATSMLRETLIDSVYGWTNLQLAYNHFNSRKHDSAVSML